MVGNSSQVESNQVGPHEHLERLVRRHQVHADRTPIADFSLAQWPQLEEFLRARARCVLDLGCGTGESTLSLARMFPAASVLGVDRSEQRLRRLAFVAPKNALTVRADSFDVLRLFARAGLRAQKIALLYPNPYPKAKLVQQRWHAHATFPLLLSSCESVELRCNWSIYAQEFAQALQWSGWRADQKELALTPVDTITAFERKYLASGHTLYQVCGSPAIGDA